MSAKTATIALVKNFKIGDVIYIKEQNESLRYSIVVGYHTDSVVGDALFLLDFYEDQLQVGPSYYNEYTDENYEIYSPALRKR